MLAILVCLMAAPLNFWPVTLFLYGPRWLVALPLLILFPTAMAWNRIGLVSLAMASWVVVFPILGYCVPWRTALNGPEDGPRLRILTCNITGRYSDANRLADLIDETKPDVVLLQEFYGVSPAQFLRGDGWHVYQGNGSELMVASRRPIRRARTLDLSRIKAKGNAASHEISFDGGTVRLVNLHATSLRTGLSQVADRREEGIGTFEEISELHAREASEIRRWVDLDSGPLILAGDFNMTPDSPTYRANWSDFGNAFANAGSGFGFTFNTRLIGLRIDHVLVGPGWKVRKCWVGPDVKSQHLPVLADLEWIGGKGTPAWEVKPEDESLEVSRLLLPHKSGPEPSRPSAPVTPAPKVATPSPPVPPTGAITKGSPKVKESPKPDPAPRPKTAPAAKPENKAIPQTEEERADFRRLLRQAVLTPGSDRVRATAIREFVRHQTLVSKGTPGGPVDREVAKLDVAGRIQAFRVAEWSELSILKHLIEIETKLVGNRRGPLNEDSAVVLAARLLLKVPPP
jgi:vancomycin resistance protein VanJ